MNGKEHSNTPHDSHKKQKDGNIQSSFEKLLKWRENENLRVLNIAERHGGIRSEQLQMNNEGNKMLSSKGQCTITVIKE